MSPEYNTTSVNYTLYRYLFSEMGQLIQLLKLLYPLSKKNSRDIATLLPHNVPNPEALLLVWDCIAETNP